MSFSSYINQIFVAKKIIRSFIFAFIPALLFYVFSLLCLKSSGFKTMEILRDPAQLSGQSSFLGFLSNIGVWLWVSSAAISFFSAFNYYSITKNRYKELLFLVGMLSMILAVDDFFMIHDRYINQNICYFTYAIFAGALLVRQYKRILEIDGFTFLLAGLLLALSILTDFSQEYIPLKYKTQQIFEEGFKFVGAATWLYFSCRIASFHSTEKFVREKLI